MDFSVKRDTERLSSLAARGVYVGTSSWKYPGWIGQVYLGDYSGPRSPVNKKRFESECLAEFVKVFPTVCFDGGYWRLPVAEQLASYARQLPDNYPIAIKVTNTITERRDRDGKDNAGYLDAGVFIEHFLEPVQSAFGGKLGPVILEFSPYFFSKPYGQQDYSPIQFVTDLHNFLKAVPKQGVMLAVEIRDKELLAHPKYLDCLGYHGVAHVLNEQTWMPEIGEQLEVPGIFTAPFTVIRALVRPGVKHNDAVKQFEPYSRTQLTLTPMREGIAETARRAMASNRQLYAYVNNRTEGNAPNTITGVMELLFGDSDPHGD